VALADGLHGIQRHPSLHLKQHSKLEVSSIGTHQLRARVLIFVVTTLLQAAWMLSET
jgi:hypothetical protein